MGGRVTETQLLARIERGERIESAEEMTEEYKENLIHLMTVQADSELSGGYGYVPWTTKGPDVEEKHVVAQIVKDEQGQPGVVHGPRCQPAGAAQGPVKLQHKARAHPGRSARGA